MYLKLVTVLFIFTIVLVSHGQENRITPLNWNEWNEELPRQSTKYTVNWQIDLPSLSYIREIVPSVYSLMEIDLTVDLRMQAFRKKTPFLMSPENKFIKAQFTLPIPTQKEPTVRVTGRSRYNNTSGRVNNGGLRNTVYKDASEYSGFFCPATGQRLLY